MVVVIYTTVTAQNVDVHHGDHTEDGVIVNRHLAQEVIHVKPEKFIIRKCLYKKQGDMIEYFDNASKALGIIFVSN